MKPARHNCWPPSPHPLKEGDLGVPHESHPDASISVGTASLRLSGIDALASRRRATLPARPGIVNQKVGHFGPPGRLLSYKPRGARASTPTMATPFLGEVLRNLRKLVVTRTASERPDEQLLQRYVRERDQAAFEA